MNWRRPTSLQTDGDMAPRRPALPGAGPERLTPRELDVVRLLAGGCTYAQIGDRLGVSPHTVTSHIKNTYRKLAVRCAAAAVMRAIQMRLLGGE